jgi:hypothetical protein
MGIASLIVRTRQTAAPLNEQWLAGSCRSFQVKRQSFTYLVNMTYACCNNNLVLPDLLPGL